MHPKQQPLVLKSSNHKCVFLHIKNSCKLLAYVPKCISCEKKVNLAVRQLIQKMQFGHTTKIAIKVGSSNLKNDISLRNRHYTSNGINSP